MMKSVGLSDEPCGTPWLILMRFEKVLSIWKYVCRLERKLLMNRRKMTGMLCYCRVWSRPLCQTLSNVFSTSMNTDAQACFLFFACMAICVNWKSLSWVLLFFLKPACSLLMMSFSSM